jgi:hypothetical protein
VYRLVSVRCISLQFFAAPIACSCCTFQSGTVHFSLSSRPSNPAVEFSPRRCQIRRRSRVKTRVNACLHMARVVAVRCNDHPWICRPFQLLAVGRSFFGRTLIPRSQVRSLPGPSRFACKWQFRRCRNSQKSSRGQLPVVDPRQYTREGSKQYERIRAVTAHP